MKVPYILLVAGLLAVSATLFYGLTMIRESAYEGIWQRQNTEKTRAFIRQCDSRSFVDTKGDTLKYLLMKPVNYESERKYPLVICLPYDGYQAPAAWWLANEELRKEYPVFLFVPFCPPGKGWGVFRVTQPSIPWYLIPLVHWKKKRELMKRGFT